MLRLLFLSYGQGLHQQEVICGVHSILHCGGSGIPFQIVVYTDEPEVFRDLPVKLHLVTPQQWRVWGGPKNFNHRRKILALQHLLKQSTDAVVLLDGDTWLRGSLQTLQERIAPGRSVMHIQEGRVSEVRTPLYKNLHQLLREERQIRDLGISADAWMWNAGVIGLHPSDLPLLDEVLVITDRLCEVSSLHILEQFAFSWVLQNRLQLSEAADLVFHYWPPYLHKPFRKLLPDLMQRATALPVEKRTGFLYRHRPRPGVFRRGKVVIKRMLQWLGILKGYCRSNEW
ncbi:MAG: hypothetical protein WCK86_23105 [Planctomycetia bacterium]